MYLVNPAAPSGAGASHALRPSGARPEASHCLRGRKPETDGMAVRRHTNANPGALDDGSGDCGRGRVACRADAVWNRRLFENGEPVPRPPPERTKAPATRSLQERNPLFADRGSFPLFVADDALH